MSTFTNLLPTLSYSDYKYLDYITWGMYILPHFGSILLCNSNPDETVRPRVVLWFVQSK